jgi:hypothetical protein
MKYNLGKIWPNLRFFILVRASIGTNWENLNCLYRQEPQYYHPHFRDLMLS